jgi:protein-S-isoprenylcysteine O-methyltransferase Ste14
LLATLVTPVGVGGVLFGAAGRFDLPGLWLYLAVLAGSSAASAVLLDPDLLEERMRPGGHSAGAVAIVGTGLSAAHWVVAGLDVGRFHWSDGVPRFVQGLGLLGMCGAILLTLWAMRVNPFFSSVVRIQPERGHHVVTGGPYRFVRHPGYAAGLVLVVTSPLALGSWWSAVPAIPAIPFFFRRIALEERLLRNELAGYTQYAARVRYRLLPGLW